MAVLLRESVGHGLGRYTADFEGDGVEGVAVWGGEGVGVGAGGGVPGEKGAGGAEVGAVVVPWCHRPRVSRKILDGLEHPLLCSHVLVDVDLPSVFPSDPG